MNLKNELEEKLPVEDLRHETALNIVRTGNLMAAKASQLFRTFDLAEAQFNVLLALSTGNGDVTQAELGKRLVVTRASITSVHDKLEGKGLVERKKVAGNRRIHHVGLPPPGVELFDKVLPLYREEIYDVLANLSDVDCRALIEKLEKTRARVRQMLTPGNGV